MPDASPDAAPTPALSDLVERLAPSVVALRGGGASLSGFAWREDLVVTAEEPLPEAEAFEAVLPGGAARAARLLGRDASTDLALLRLEGGGLAPARLDAPAPRAGEPVLALGAREGRAVVAAGVVGFAGPAWRSLRGGLIDARLELDLRLPPGAEGGLALDAHGRALGMAALAPRGRAIAIPSATIERVAPRLLSHGRVPRGYLGLGLQPIGIDASDGGGRGLLVVSVAEGGPGARAGLRQGDIVTDLDGEPIAGMRDLMRALGPDRVNTAATLRFRRAGEPREAVVAIAERPAG